jgi:hypothetical protein
MRLLLFYFYYFIILQNSYLPLHIQKLSGLEYTKLLSYVVLYEREMWSLVLTDVHVLHIFYSNLFSQ